jgi:hypothetical protein
MDTNQFMARYSSFKRNHLMDFTPAEIDLLTAPFSGHVQMHREHLLPLILGDWGRVELKEHFKYPSPQEVRAQQKQLERLARRANELARAIADLGSDARSAIADCQVQAFVTLKSGIRLPRPGVGEEQFLEAERRLAETPETLQDLAVAAAKAAAETKAHPVRLSTLRGCLILQDLSTIYEYATDERASRKIHVDPHEDAGQEYGAFYDLARAAWSIIFGSQDGLSYALQQWAVKRAQYGHSFALIENISFRHAEWGIFDQ